MIMNIYTLNINEYHKLSPKDQKEVIKNFDLSLSQYGCFYIQNDFLKESLLQEIQLSSLNFFNQDIDLKKKYIKPANHIARGYSALSEESLSRTLGQKDLFDLNESFQIGPHYIPESIDHKETFYQYHPNIWPYEIPLFAQSWNLYYQEMEKISEHLLYFFSHALGLTPSYFLEKNHYHTARLRARFYPNITSPDFEHHFRVSPHTDYGTFSILHTSLSTYGLQLYCSDKKAWMNLEHRPKTFFVNIGDILEKITNRHWNAPLHRVVTPSISSEYNVDRLSLIYFHGLRHDCLVEPHPFFQDGLTPKDFPMTVAEYLKKKLMMAQYK